MIQHRHGCGYSEPCTCDADACDDFWTTATADLRAWLARAFPGVEVVEDADGVEAIERHRGRERWMAFAIEVVVRDAAGVTNAAAADDGPIFESIGAWTDAWFERREDGALVAVVAARQPEALDVEEWNE